VKTPPHLQRNFVLGVVSGVGYNLYTAVLSTELVMAWFLSELTQSNLLISLLFPIEFGSWYFLQLLLSGYVQRQPRTLPLYRVMALVRVVSVALLALGTFVLDRTEPLLIIFLLTFTANSIAAGVAALPFLNIVAKTIPPRRRGMYFGWRRFLGGLLGLAGGVLVKALLSPDFPLAFPDNYALLFSVGFVFTVLLVGPFSLIAEPSEIIDQAPTNLKRQLGRALRLPNQNHAYGRYLGLRVAVVAAGYALPFYAVYARRVLGAADDIVGVYLIGLTLAGVLSNLVLGQIGDRYGNQLLMRLVAITAILPPTLALSIDRLPSFGLEKSLVFTLVFVFQGMHRTAIAIGGNNYVLELAPSIQRVLYLGFANGVVGTAIFLSPVGGAIVDGLGFEALFAFGLICSLVAIMLSLGLEEPRRNNERKRNAYEGSSTRRCGSSLSTRDP
jgi:MFS family permease